MILSTGGMSAQGGAWSPRGVPGLGRGVMDAWSWGVPALGGACSRGVPGPGECLVPGGGGVCFGWVPGPGGLLSGKGLPGLGGCLVETPWDGNCCGRYASYWNAFLLLFK